MLTLGELWKTRGELCILVELVQKVTKMPGEK